MLELEDFLEHLVDTNNKLYRNKHVLQYLLHFTVTEEHCRSLMVMFPNIVEDIISIQADKSLCYPASEILLNLSGFSEGAYFLVTSRFESADQNEEMTLVRHLLELTLEPTSTVADITCKTIANITRVEDIAIKTAADLLIYNAGIVNTMIDVITDETYNSAGQTLDYMSHVMGNLTQAYEFRSFLVESDESHLNRLMSVISKRQASNRREGVFSILRNCCFDTEFHSVLLGSKFNILPNLLYPLAGLEYINYDLYRNLPIDLQYLPADKQRETNPENRKKLIESIYQLSATEFGRCFLRNCDTYIILKHYYNWEVDEINKSICEGVIGLLIRSEDDIGVENLKELDQQFNNLDIT